MYADCCEIWVPVIFDNDYEVSNKGIVRRKSDKKIVSVSNRDGRGYQSVALNKKKYYLHRVVACSFWAGDHEGYDVNHIDGNKHNNDIRNLEMATRKENIQHAFQTGLKGNKRVYVVRCKDCVHHSEEKCKNRPDYFYCYDGKKKWPR